MIALQKLLQLGFSEKEAEVYLMLNKMGPTPPSTLARLTHINRTTIYAILNKLQEKELVLWFKQGGTVFYSLDDIKKLVSREKEQVGIAESVIDELKNEQNGTAVQIQYYRGKEGMKELLENIIQEKPEELCSFINSDNIHMAVGENFMKDWISRRIENKIFARLLLEDCETTRLYKDTDKEGFRETRVFPSKYRFQSGYYLFKDSICLFDTSENMLAVRIRSEHITAMFKQSFEFMWDSLEK